MSERRPARRDSALLEEWVRIQGALTQLTGLSFTTVGRAGKVVAETGDLSLCRLLSEGTNGGLRCSDSCLAEAGRTGRENALRFFRCRAGLECFAAPVRVDGATVATVLGGRVLEKAPDHLFFQDLAREHGLPEERVMQAVGRLPLGNSRSLARAAEMVQGIADALFTGIYRHTQAQRRLSLLTSLFRLGTDLGPEKAPHEIHALVVNTVSILFDVQGAALYLLAADGGRFRLASAFGSAEQHCFRLELHDGLPIVAEVLRERSPRLSDDYHLLLRCGFPEQVRSLALFPLLSGEETTGLLVIINTPLDAESAQLVFAFCSQASTAIQNTILRQELKQKAEEVSRLVRIQHRIGDLLDHDSLLAAIFEEATTMTTAEQASLMVVNRRTNELIVKLAHGDHSPVIRQVALGSGEGIAGRVARSGEPLLVTDIESDPRFGRRRRPRYRSNSFLLVPITVAGRVIGVLNLADKSVGPFSAEDLKGLNAVLSYASVALQRSELFSMTKELRKISTTDGLTKLLNRRYFQRRSHEEIMRAQRFGSPLSLVMIDVDDFKSYNDRHGHLAGDALLVGVSRLMREAVRGIDVVSRFGGEEFAILSPHTGAADALAVAERVREAVRRHTFVLGREALSAGASVSAGVASFPEQAGSLQELIDNADRALYRAKRAGKDRVVLFSVA